MVPVAIDDPGDARLAEYRHLRDAELRRRGDDPTFIAEGISVIGQLLRSPYPVRSVLLTPAKYERLAVELEAIGGDAPVYVAAPAVLEEIAGFHIHRGALASASRRPLPSPADLVGGARLLLVLEAINDHENLGALFRNAAAFGADAVLLCPRCADPLYRRSVRVSMGHVLHVPFARLEPWPAALELIPAAGIRLLALTPDPSAMPVDRLEPTSSAGGPAAVLVGAEGPGLSRWAQAAASVAVRVPMAPGVDSLNVATAAAIALHHLGSNW
jgi:tRNA G18 (ribose-2'-O)-methylase SpoU